MGGILRKPPDQAMTSLGFADGPGHSRQDGAYGFIERLV